MVPGKVVGVLNLTKRIRRIATYVSEWNWKYTRIARAKGGLLICTERGTVENQDGPTRCKERVFRHFQCESSTLNRKK